MSSIPGPKPPPAPEIVPLVSEPVRPILPLSEVIEAQAKPSSNAVDEMLNSSTAEVMHEAALVTAHAVDESKTVGGLGITLLTLGFFIVTSPWSWIAALLLGPVRVWVFFQLAVTEGIAAFLKLVLIVITFFGVLLVLLIGLSLFRWAT